ncbi:nucleotide disphospho-sugar-binding domain-containing protein [uncultured Cellulomonas sp.]|uniref:glycosyltransferase n=1 Tax=uncultured Cellulomonas sp. TaxID=189682 RepID=UPI0028E63BAF|nr:nucleotide disphospho-sugar-binding domain-containing protein [uncultured Cellulomonas sp.]
MSRILFALTPVTGHVRPALPLARALVAEGHEVVVYAGTKFAEGVLATGAKHAPIVQGRDLDDAELDAWSHAHGAPAPGIKRLQWDVLHHFVGTVPGFLADLDEIVAAERPDVLVTDNGFVAGAITARRHRLPSVLFSVSPLAISSKDTAPFGLGLQPPRTGLDGLRYAVLGWFIERVLFREAQKAAERVVTDAGQPVPEGFFLDWVQTSATRVLHTSVPGFEYPRSDLPENVELVGPFLPAGVDRFEPPVWWDDVVEARRTGRPVVLVTQGTVATDPERLIWPAIEALADEDVLVVATTEPAGYPENVRATPFVPFDRLLPMVDVMITNGGFGGVQQALASGVPVLVAGRTEDKAEVGARVTWSGVGLALPTDRVTDATTSEAVRHGVRRLLDNPSFARRAGELAAEYAEHDGVGRAVSVITEVAGLGR